ncbi:DUF4225 domain-containing protein [Pseudomonas sp. GD03860]|uniref:DUF4225 domain-containing protein n=1 Tax=Pseudomonas TaxID=286 RepID=UPI002363CB0F|nr:MULTISPECIES: DUF4225 domain-containing protein [Pseudomonas]MDD2059980.1 DUF4225 domain-containing protein [Pseudomonas putida]MDH0637069.1 DUF4225 domain-containing protein [Pseudomonas sp. GD03860]
MSGRPSPYRLDSNAYWDVSEAAARLTKQACTSSARLFSDGKQRMQFNREFAYYAKRVVDDVALGKKAPEQGLSELNQILRRLATKTVEIGRKGIGIVAGVAQVGTGAGICYASVGTLCAVAGVPLMAHGANNIYENGRKVLEGRSDVEGPVRKGYQRISKALGGSRSEGNIAYASMDLGFSSYGLFRMIIKPEAWRLYYYLPSDYVRSYQRAGGLSLAVEAVTNIESIVQIREELAR